MSRPSITGFRLAACRAGLYPSDRLDVALLEMNAAAHCAAVFTRNACPAAPVLLARQHLQTATPRFLLVNAGNANAGTGASGLRDAEALCSELARLAGCRTDQVLPFSTGVIGEDLPVEKLQQCLPRLLGDLSEDHWQQVASAIMTTDTRHKLLSRVCEIDGQQASLVGVAKGSGMIRPDMATMLAFIATDVAMPRSLAQSLLEEAVRDSFNCITVDGDTSTNDACVFVANGTHRELCLADEAQIRQFAVALNALCIDLAQSIVRDGEGAGKLVSIEVAQGRDERECRNIAFAIAESPLCKVALAASDPNWGRLLAAIGRGAMYSESDMSRLDITINDFSVVRAGCRSPDYSEQKVGQAMQRDEIKICVDLHLGGARARVWTCDLTHEYIRINSAYRT